MFNVKTVQTQLGHKTPDFTMKVYAYSTASLSKESAARMDQRIRSLSKKEAKMGN